MDKTSRTGEQGGRGVTGGTLLIAVISNAEVVRNVKDRPMTTEQLEELLTTPEKESLAMYNRETVVIYSIDNAHDLRTLAKFTHWIDMNDALGKTKCQTAPAMGMWEGVLEQSFVSSLEDYRNYVIPSGYVDGQEAVLVVRPNDTAVLSDINLNPMSDETYDVITVSKEEAGKHQGYTYRPDLGLYFVAVPRNESQQSEEETMAEQTFEQRLLARLDEVIEQGVERSDLWDADGTNFNVDFIATVGLFLSAAMAIQGSERMLDLLGLAVSVAQQLNEEV